MLLWDESHIWGLMLWRSLCLLGFPPKVIRSEDICQGILNDRPPHVLIVPGGWASRKAASLGEKGRSAIRSFLSDTAGTYLGLCGGAGLALGNTNQHPSLELCSWKRKPVHQRLPNCSGHIYINVNENLTLSEAHTQHLAAPIWWPSQFDPQPDSQTSVIASYHKPASDFWVADLPAVSLSQESIASWEKIYRINLDPKLLKGEPCLIQGSYGQGHYVLSYIHFETPASLQANTWLQMLIASMTDNTHNKKSALIPEWHLQESPLSWDNKTLVQARKDIETIIATGQENFLLCWRKPWLLGWKRGIPGFAINSLYALIVQSLALPPNPHVHSFWYQHERRFKHTIEMFRKDCLFYLQDLRLELNQHLQSSNDQSSDFLGQKKKQLFGPFPGQGGLFGELMTMLQELLWLQIHHLPSDCEID
jgi:hypothetical protein